MRIRRLPLNDLDRFSLVSGFGPRQCAHEPELGWWCPLAFRFVWVGPGENQRLPSPRMWVYSAWGAFFIEFDPNSFDANLAPTVEDH